jgi:hypothetical protein
MNPYFFFTWGKEIVSTALSPRREEFFPRAHAGLVEELGSWVGRGYLGHLALTIGSTVLLWQRRLVQMPDDVNVDPDGAWFVD